jgi:hypothetical protein
MTPVLNLATRFGIAQSLADGYVPQENSLVAHIALPYSGKKRSQKSQYQRLTEKRTIPHCGAALGWKIFLRPGAP